MICPVVLVLVLLIPLALEIVSVEFVRLKALAPVKLTPVTLQGVLMSGVSRVAPAKVTMLAYGEAGTVFVLQLFAVPHRASVPPPSHVTCALPVDARRKPNTKSTSIRESVRRCPSSTRPSLQACANCSLAEKAFLGRLMDKKRGLFLRSTVVVTLGA